MFSVNDRVRDSLWTLLGLAVFFSSSCVSVASKGLHCGSDYFSRQIQARVSQVGWQDLQRIEASGQTLEWRFWGQFGLGPLACYQVVFRDGNWWLANLPKSGLGVSSPLAVAFPSRLAERLLNDVATLPASTCELPDTGLKQGLFPFGIVVEKLGPKGYHSEQYDFPQMLASEDLGHQALHEIYRDLQAMVKEHFDPSSKPQQSKETSCYLQHEGFLDHRAHLSGLGDFSLGEDVWETRIWTGFAGHPLQGWVIQRKGTSWIIRHLEPVVADIRFLADAPIRDLDLDPSLDVELVTSLADLEAMLLKNHTSAFSQDPDRIIDGSPIWIIQRQTEAGVQTFCRPSYEWSEPLKQLFSLLKKASGS